MSLPPIDERITGLVSQSPLTCECGDELGVLAVARYSEDCQPLLVTASRIKYPGLVVVRDATTRYVPTSNVRLNINWAPRLVCRCPVSPSRALVFPPSKNDIYRHYKGNTYIICSYGLLIDDVITKGLAEVAVVYRSIDHPDELPWVRLHTTGPAPWLGTVDVHGIEVNRFSRVVTSPYEEVAE